MAKDSGRFDLEDAGWEKLDEEDSFSRLLIRSSREVQNGAIWGFVGGLLIGLIVGVLAVTVRRGFWLLAVAMLFLGLIAGALIGKVIEVNRAMRRGARRAKREAQ